MSWFSSRPAADASAAAPPSPSKPPSPGMAPGTVNRYTISFRNQHSHRRSPSPPADDLLGGIGATNQWERVPSSFYGLSSVRARAAAAVTRRRGGDGAGFVEATDKRHGLSEFFKLAGESEAQRLKALKELLDAGVDPNRTVKVE